MGHCDLTVGNLVHIPYLKCDCCPSDPVSTLYQLRAWRRYQRQLETQTQKQAEWDRLIEETTEYEVSCRKAEVEKERLLWERVAKQKREAKKRKRFDEEKEHAWLLSHTGILSFRERTIRDDLLRKRARREEARAQPIVLLDDDNDDAAALLRTSTSEKPVNIKIEEGTIDYSFAALPTPPPSSQLEEPSQTQQSIIVDDLEDDEDEAEETQDVRPQADASAKVAISRKSGAEIPNQSSGLPFCPASIRPPVTTLASGLRYQPGCSNASLPRRAICTPIPYRQRISVRGTRLDLQMQMFAEENKLRVVRLKNGEDEVAGDFDWQRCFECCDDDNSRTIFGKYAQHQQHEMDRAKREEQLSLRASRGERLEERRAEWYEWLDDDDLHRRERRCCFPSLEDYESLLEAGKRDEDIFPHLVEDDRALSKLDICLDRVSHYWDLSPWHVCDRGIARTGSSTRAAAQAGPADENSTVQQGVGMDTEMGQTRERRPKAPCGVRERVSEQHLAEHTVQYAVSQATVMSGLVERWQKDCNYQKGLTSFN